MANFVRSMIFLGVTSPLVFALSFGVLGSFPSVSVQLAQAESSSSEKRFSSWDEAIRFIRANYSKEEAATSRSSWIRGAEYFEAAGAGYLIINMNGKDYLFKGVPKELWREFRNAPSLGTFYNQRIRGRYEFQLGG